MTKKNDATTLSRDGYQMGSYDCHELSFRPLLSDPNAIVQDIGYLTPEEKEIFISARKELDGLFILLKDFPIVISGSYITEKFFRLYHPDTIDWLADDIDIFVPGMDNFAKVIKEIESNPFSKELISDHPNYHRRFSSPFGNLDIINFSAEKEYDGNILKTFDLLHVAIGIDNKNAYFIEGSLDAIKNKEIIIHKYFSFKRIAERIVKYINRGFSISTAETSNLGKLMKLYHEKFEGQDWFSTHNKNVEKIPYIDCINEAAIISQDREVYSWEIGKDVLLKHEDLPRLGKNSFISPKT